MTEAEKDKLNAQVAEAFGPGLSGYDPDNDPAPWGWEKCTGGTRPMNFAGDPKDRPTAATWDLVAWMEAKGYTLFWVEKPYANERNNGVWRACFSNEGRHLASRNGRTAPEAICRAALAVVEAEKC